MEDEGGGKETEGERWTRENLELIGGVPWRMNEDQAGDGEELRAEVTIMDKDYREIIRKEELRKI